MDSKEVQELVNIIVKEPGIKEKLAQVLVKITNDDGYKFEETLSLIRQFYKENPRKAT